MIITANCGSVVRDGVDGFLVPIRDGKAIAKRLEELATIPDLLAQLSTNALATAADHTIHRYGERLLEALSLCHR